MEIREIWETLLPFSKKDSALGVSKKRREYDIPLHRKMGSEFLTLLIGLMTFLAILALTGSFVLSSITESWTSGLENKLTVEIPAETDKGEILSLQQVTDIATKTAQNLQDLDYVMSASALSEADIKELLSPWLGENADYQNIPLPGLVAVELKNFKSNYLLELNQRVKKINSTSVVNTHKKWLKDIISFAGTLQFTALVITIVIAFTTFAAVAGAIKSRIAAHFEELELLHLMGASDKYIARQFQRHAFILSVKGAAVGLIIAAGVLYLIGFLLEDMDTALLPNYHFGWLHYGFLICVPLIIGLIATLTARTVAYRELAAMP